MDDIVFLDASKRISKDALQLDIELCIQCLIMHRRKAQVEAVISILQVSISLRFVIRHGTQDDLFVKGTESEHICDQRDVA